MYNVQTNVKVDVNEHIDELFLYYFVSLNINIL
jgi:hypothetical protein